MTEPEPPADDAVHEFDDTADVDGEPVGELAESVVEVGEPAGASAEGEPSGSDS